MSEGVAPKPDKGLIESLLDFAENVVDGTERAVTGKVAGKTPSNKRSPWRVIDALDEHDGSEVWIVTNGRETATCTTQTLAEKICAALE